MLEGTQRVYIYRLKLYCYCAAFGLPCVRCYLGNRQRHTVEGLKSESCVGLRRFRLPSARCRDLDLVPVAVPWSS